MTILRIDDASISTGTSIDVSYWDGYWLDDKVTILNKGENLGDYTLADPEICQGGVLTGPGGHGPLAP